MNAAIRFRRRLSNSRGSFSLPEVIVGSIISLAILGAIAGMMISLMDTTVATKEKSFTSSGLLKLETTLRQDLASAASVTGTAGQKSFTAVVVGTKCENVEWALEGTTVTRSLETFSGPLDKVSAECTGTSSEVRSRIVARNVTDASFTELNFAGSKLIRQANGSITIEQTAASENVSPSVLLSKSVWAVQTKVSVSTGNESLSANITQPFNNQRN